MLARRGESVVKLRLPPPVSLGGVGVAQRAVGAAEVGSGEESKHGPSASPGLLISRYYFFLLHAPHRSA